MGTNDMTILGHNAILTIAEIKVAVDAFDHGEINVRDALDAITAACVEHADAVRPRREAA